MWRGAPARRLLGAAVLAVAAGIAPTFLRTFLPDMDFYAHVADKLLTGGVLYKDAIDTKPPAIFLHYAIVFRLFGENNLAAVKAITGLFLVLSVAAVHGIWRKLFGPGDAAFAALVFALASVCGWAGDFLSSNTEILANVFILAGVYAVSADRFGRRPSRLVAAGALFGVAFLYRFQSGAVLAAYALYLANERRQFWPVAARLAWVATGFVIPAAIFVSRYANAGNLAALGDFVRYDYYYIRGGALYWPALAGQAAIVVASQVQILALAGWQIGRVLRRTARTASEYAGDRFLVAWFGVSCLAFGSGGRFFAHYFVQALPPAALLAARRLTTSDRVHTPAPVNTGSYLSVAPVLLALHAAAFFVVNAAVLWATREPRNPYPDLVRFAQARTTKRDPVYVWTPRTHVLFDMDRVFATRFVSNDFLVGRMYGTEHRRSSATAESARVAAVPELWPLLMHDLEAQRPPLVIDDVEARSAFTIRHYPLLAAFVARNYAPCVEINGFCVYVLASN